MREVRTLTREREEATARDHQDRLEAMENLYPHLCVWVGCVCVTV